MLKMLSLNLDLEETWINCNLLELLLNINTDKPTAVFTQTVLHVLLSWLLLGLAHILSASSWLITNLKFDWTFTTVWHICSRLASWWTLGWVRIVLDTLLLLFWNAPLALNCCKCSLFLSWRYHQVVFLHIAILSFFLHITRFSLSNALIHGLSWFFSRSRTLLIGPLRHIHGLSSSVYVKFFVDVWGVSRWWRLFHFTSFLFRKSLMETIEILTSF